MKKLPEIFYLNDKDLDILISQIGISSDAQKMILRVIVEHKQNDLDYAEFIEDYSVKIRGLKGELDFLFRKLYEVKRGIIVNRVTSEGEFVPFRIIVTDEGSYDFYYYAIEDLFLKHYVGIELFSALLTVKNIDSSLLAFEKKFIPISDADINFKYFQENSSFNKIFVLNFLIIPSGKALYFVEFIKKVLFNIASNSIVKDIFVRAKNLKLSEYDRILEDGISGVGVVHNLLLGILENKDEILNKKGVNIPKNYFTFLEILSTYISNEKNLEELKAVESIRIDETLKSIEKTMEFRPGYINMEEFQKILKEHSGELSDPEYFLKVANEYFFESKIKDVLPRVFSIKSGVYLYKPCVYSMFLKEFDRILIDVKDELRDGLFKILKGDRDSSSILTEEGLDKTLREFILNYGINDYCFRNKVAFLDFIVSHYRRVSKTQNIQTHLKDIIKTEAAKYFKNSNEFLPLYRVYKIDLPGILKSAYKELGLLKKVLLFLTGRHQSYKEALSRLDIKVGMKSSVGLFDPNERDQKQRNKRQKQKEDKIEQARNSYVRKGKETPPFKEAEAKNYSKTEQDEAWSKFGDRLNKK
ncbi:hypothetical protein [Borrelia sp. RT1S]|uniref:hypothetical protein n=1 Tax=Borrelia sp. RT1S TaxID=2898580 RepID=UPI001E33022D|nr:hypothetical protein [Borrelia sp. RT1S]UGQ16970.1 hypothetical protein LSO05_00800 [Borrelia sp. RT1S]